ncbi:MAG: 50S ribosomal protein L18 [Desulfonauticus sp. 38_4375]|nr:MAG: 50S ribosomal protein L18 [Desulfonauticus sp. 38_4375]
MRKTRQEARLKRKVRIRKKIRGTSERPRLVIFRSNRYIYAQIIDDVTGKTLVAYSSLVMGKKNVTKEIAKEVGQKVAELAKSKNIEQVVFDRNGYLYHGRVKALADGAREGGLKF